MEEAMRMDKRIAITHYYNWLPTHNQELLLKAALLSGQAMREAWQEWSTTVDLHDLDYGSQRLLPLLYRNLKTQGINHPWIRQFKNRYLDIWARNQVLFGKISPLLQSFRERRIATLILKGASLTIGYYKDFGLRPMDDFDFLVPTSRALEALELLQEMGWIPKLRFPDRRLKTSTVSILHAMNFQNSENCGIDLHWHLLPDCLKPDADWDFWEGANPVKIGDIRTLSLNQTDELFHTCIHGFRWNPMPPIRWVADAMKILNSGMAVDWNRMISLAQKCHLILPLQDTLQYLVDRFDAPIQSDLFSKLEYLPVSTEEIREYKAQKNRPYALVPYLWAYYPRISRDTGRPLGLFGFIKYLQDLWGLKYIWQVPISFGWRVLRKLLRIPIE